MLVVSHCKRVIGDFLNVCIMFLPVCATCLLDAHMIVTYFWVSLICTIFYMPFETMCLLWIVVSWTSFFPVFHVCQSTFSSIILWIFLCCVFIIFTSKVCCFTLLVTRKKISSSTLIKILNPKTLSSNYALSVCFLTTLCFFLSCPQLSLLQSAN